MNSLYRFVIVLIVTVVCILLLFNFATPYIRQIMPNQFAKGELIMDSLKNENFHPKVIAFGSSIVETGVNGYVLRKELQNDYVYNLAGPAQTLGQICGYFPFLSSSVNIVVLGVKLTDFVIDTDSISLKMKINSNEEFNAFFSSKKDISKRECFLIENFKDRACLKSGIQIKVREITDDDAPGAEENSIIYPYLYPTNRTQSTYQRDITTQNQAGNPLLGKEVNYNYIARLAIINEYFKKKGINFIMFISPKSPDINYTKDDISKKFLSQVGSSLPKDLKYIDCFYSLTADDFYDGEHPNRIGAEKLSKIIATYIKKMSL